MALDFSKFIVAPTSSEWLQKLPEYEALGRKAGEGAKPAKLPLQTIFTATDVSKFIPTGVVLQQAQQDEINNQLTDIRNNASQQLTSGLDQNMVMLDVFNKVNDLKKNTKNLQQLSLGYDELEQRAKNTPGLNLNNLKSNFNKYFLLNPDGTPKKVTDILATGGDVINQINNVVTGFDDNYDNQGFVDLISKAKGSTTSSSVTVVDKKGKKTSDQLLLGIPATGYVLKDVVGNNNPNDFELTVDGGEETISDPVIAQAYHTVLNDSQTGDKVNVVDLGTVNSLASINPGIQGFIEQETRKFQKEAEKNGAKVLDAAGNIDPAFQAHIDNFKRALVYKSYQDMLPALASGNVKVGSSDAAARPKAVPSINLNISNKATQMDFNAFNRTMDETPADADGYKSIHDLFAGIQDRQGIDYGPGYGDLRVGWNNTQKKWTIKTYTKDLNGSPVFKDEMTLSRFIASHPTRDPGSKDDAQFLALEQYIKKQRKGKLD
jgi:hypothetical protein